MPTYALNQRYTSELTSANGTVYTLTLWDGVITGGSSNPIKIDGSGVKLNYDAPTVDDKNSPILTSSLEVPYVVDDNSIQSYFESIRSSDAYAERDVWITLNVGTTYAAGTLLWSGYVLLDEETQQDVSLPYTTTFTAVDGLSSLKEIPFIRDTNSDTGAVPTYPYTRADTYDNGGHRRCVFNSQSWFPLLLGKAGQLLADDDATGSDLENWTIQTAVNWWNEDMGATPSVAEDPLMNLQLSMRPWYSKDENNYWKAPMCWDVLEGICKTFNMRLIYWKHCFHFIQINEYNSDEQDSTYWSNPVNIPTRRYYYSGSQIDTRNYVGDITYSIYKQLFENATTNTGLQKLAGTTYDALPAMKRVDGTYIENAGMNVFTGFPLFLTDNLVSGLATSWPTDGVYREYQIRPQSGTAGAGVYEIMELTDAKDLKGIVCKLYCDFYNESGSDIEMELLWTIRAKPSSSAWGDSDNLVMYRHQYTTYAKFRWKSYEFPLSNNQEYMLSWIWIPANTGQSSPVTIEIFNSTTNSTTQQTNYLVPVDDTMEGDWDFQFYTFTGYEDDVTDPMNAQGETALYSHGRITDVQNPSASTGSGGSSGAVTPIQEKQVPTYYPYGYSNTLQTLSPPTFQSQFVPVATGASDFGAASASTQVQQATNDSYIYDIGEIKWGDGTGANTFSTIKVYDGSNWVFVDSQGKWAQLTYTWGGSSFSYGTPTYDKQLVQLLAETIMFNQSNAILTANTTTALSVNDKYYTGTTKLKFFNPIAKLKDVDTKEYMMMTSSWNISMDEWNGTFVEVVRSVPSSYTVGSSSSSSTGGVGGTGPGGGGGGTGPGEGETGGA